LEVELEIRPGIAFLRLHGSAGVTEAAAVRVALENLVRQGIGAIVVDLGDLHYVASVAIAAIAAGICRAKADRDRVRLAAPSADVRDILTRSRAARCMRIFPSVDAAAAAVSSLSDRTAPGPRQDQAGSREKAAHPTRIAVHGDAQERPASVRVRIGRGGALKRLEARLLGIGTAGPPTAEVA
jgi:anti-anti-sigma factor